MVSVGIPVYNGAGRLRQALDSILAQTLTEFEVIISDNGSTDATPTICAEYAARDPRIRVFRQTRNLGLPRNWNFVARQACGEYFKWASCNDWLSPDMLAACVSCLQMDPSAVLAFGGTALIDADGRILKTHEGDFALLGDSPSARFCEICERLGLNNAVNGVIRRDALLRTGLIRPYPASDYVLMAELALQGKFKLLPQTLFYRRTDPTSITTGLQRIERLRLHNPRCRGTESIELRRHIDLMTVALTTKDVRVTERLKSLLIAVRHAVWARQQIAADLAESLRALLASKRIQRSR